MRDGAAAGEGRAAVAEGARDGSEAAGAAEAVFLASFFGVSFFAGGAGGVPPSGTILPRE